MLEKIKHFKGSPKEGSYSIVGQVCYNMAKQHYNFKKTFRIVQPNNDINEYTVNKRLYDDKSQQLMQIENDVSVGQFDVRIIGSSTLPSNKWGEWQIYMEAYQAGLIDRVEALKKTEIFDKEGVLQRNDEMAQMQSMLQQAQEQLKKVSGDLQTAQRETVSSRQRAEVEKFKSRLKEQELDSKANSKLQLGRLQDAVKLESEKLRMNTRSEAQKGKEKSQEGAK